MSTLIARRTNAASAAVALLAIAFAAKGWRYLSDLAPAPDAALVRVQTVMARHGWQSTGVRRFPLGMPLTAATFHKPECPNPITVTLMGAKTELQDYVRMQHGGDVVFVRDGRADSRIAASEQSIGRLERLATWLSGRSAAANMPILAISPAPTTSATCAAPDATAWVAAAE